MKPGEFTKNVCELAKKIPSGRVTTYGLLAVSAGGHPILAQMITSILSKSTDVDQIPFHRIVYSDGRVWLDPKYKAKRLKLYNKEGIKLDKNFKIINFEKLIYYFDD
ncbi:MAG: MGMT family protein [Candidatus Shapirobacteria bacterium]|nr:MGMT family protein [Candidatus Shapirobacteria bacterium]